VPVTAKLFGRDSLPEIDLMPESRQGIANLGRGTFAAKNRMQRLGPGGIHAIVKYLHFAD